MATDGLRGTTRGFDVLAVSVPVVLTVALVVACVGLPTRSLGAAVLGVAAGIATAAGLTKLSERRLPPWVNTVGIAAGVVIGGLFADASLKVAIGPLAFCAAMVSAGLLLRRRQLRR